MPRVLLAVGKGPPILWPFAPHEVRAVPGDRVWDDDPLIFGTHMIQPADRARLGIVTTEPGNEFREADEDDEPTPVEHERGLAIYDALGYDPGPG